MPEIDIRKIEEEAQDNGIEIADLPYNSLNSKKPEVINQKSNSKSETKEIDKLKHALHSSRRTLLRVKSAFPFDFFPNEVIVDENKIDVINKNFFYSQEVFSIPIENVNGVTSSTNLLFGELRIEAWGISKLPLPVKYLWKKDAVKARRIISGLIMAHDQQIDMTKIKLTDARKTLEDIGRNQESSGNANSA